MKKMFLGSMILAASLALGAQTPPTGSTQQNEATTTQTKKHSKKKTAKKNKKENKKNQEGSDSKTQQ